MPRGRANRECRTWLRKYASRSPKSLRTQAPAHRGNWRLLATPPRSPFAAPAPRRVRVLVALRGRKELRASDQRAFSPSFRSRLFAPLRDKVTSSAQPLVPSGQPSVSILTEPRDELAPFHSITSSARASSVGGTSRPRALAVVRLIMRSNLVGCRIGRSAGFSPLRRLNRGAISGRGALMLRLSRRLRPVSGSRCFNSMQIRGQGRLLHVFRRAFRVHRRLLRWILNSPRRSFKQRVLVDR